MINFRLCSEFNVKLLSTILLFSLFFSAHSYSAKEQRIAVAYPEVREPYNQVFISLREGVAANSSQTPAVYPLVKGGSSVDFLRWVQAEKISGVVALGNRGLNLTLELQEKVNLPFVVGGTFFNGRNNGLKVPSVSMAPEPKYLFEKLLELFPNAKTVNVVYQAEDEWLITRSKKSATALGLTLNVRATQDVRELASAYRDILKTQKSNTQALWLPYSGRTLEKAILNEVLGVAWRRDLTVFSSNLADVSKGILFSLYPDNDLNGKRLAGLLRTQLELTTKQESALYLSEDLFSALNTRTAEHLGIRIGSDEKSRYKILFPLKR